MRTATNRIVKVGLAWYVFCHIAVARNSEEWVPLHVDTEWREWPPEIASYDHLKPIDHAVPEFHYLAQYWAQPNGGKQLYAVVIRDAPSGRYYIEQGEVPKRVRVLDKPYNFSKRGEITAPTATAIYDLWVNALLQTHYDRSALSAIVTGADTFTFSTFVPHLGWLHGYTLTSVEGDLPPSWLRDAGEGLLEFVTKSSEDQMSEERLRTKIEATRDKLYKYLQSHHCNQR